MAADDPNAVISRVQILEFLGERDLRYQQRFDAQQLALQDALTAQEKAVEAALLAAKEAVTKAEAATEKRFDSVNAFRAQLADQSASFMPRAEYDANHKALEDKSNMVGDRQNRMDGNIAGMRESRAEQRGNSNNHINLGQSIMVGVSALMAIAAIILTLLLHH